MKTIKAFRTRLDKEALSMLSNGMDTVTKIDAVLSEHFASSPSEIESRYRTELMLEGDSGLNGLNSHLSTIIPLARDLLVQGTSHLQTLESFIALHVPKMEDGNNFGVTVQMTIAKFLKDTRENWVKATEKIPSYYKDRAEAVEKLNLPRVSRSETKTDTKCQGTGGKDGSTDTTENKFVIEEKTANAGGGDGPDVHRLGHIVALDVQCYVELGRALTDLRDGYAVVLDNMEKNREKIESPKGSGAGNSMGMY